MYMHQFRKTAPPRIPELKIGKKYQVSCYHTGDFAGVCENTGKVAVFRVTRKTKELEAGQFVEVWLDSTVKIREI